MILGIVALAAAILISPQLRIREVTYTDESVYIEVIEPAGS